MTTPSGNSDSSSTLTVGVWFEYFPDWLPLVGRDGTSRLVAYLISGFAKRTDVSIRFELWGPSFAESALHRFVSEMPRSAQQLCSVGRVSHANPFAGCLDLTSMTAATVREVPLEVRDELLFVLEILTGGRDLYARGPYEYNTRSDFVLTALEANNRSKVDVWYIPAARFFHAMLLKAPVVQSFPDNVYREFSELDAGEGASQLIADRDSFEFMAQACLDRADLSVSFSEQVRLTHLLKHFDFPNQRAHVIRHGCVTLTKDEQPQPDDAEDSRRKSRRVVIDYIKGLPKRDLSQAINERVYLENLHGLEWIDQPFVLFPTVLRPYKNMLGVMQAVKHLDEWGNPVRIVTTADILGPNDTSGCASFVAMHSLESLVISIPKIPDTVLLSLYALSHAAIAPSFFEGGVPFMVTEALSVDTPVIVADTPVLREVIFNRAEEFSFFDPHNPHNIANAIVAVLSEVEKDRAATVAHQKVVFASVFGRSWEQVSYDYENVFREAIANPRIRADDV